MLTPDDITFTWLSQAHRDDVLRIELGSFDRPWSGAQLDRECTRPFRTWFVVLYRGDAVGHVLYESRRRGGFLRVVRLAVHPLMRRHGIGRAVLGMLKRRAVDLGCSALVADVPEAWVAACCFYRSCGVMCECTLPGWGEDGSDLYRFAWAVPAGGLAARADRRAARA